MFRARRVRLVLCSVIVAATWFCSLHNPEQAVEHNDSSIISLPPPETPPAEVFAAGAVAAAATAIAEPSIVERLRVNLSPCPAAGCELRFRFSMPMVHDAHLESADHPEIGFEPPTAGTFTWRATNELVFVPAAGALQWGRSVTVTMAEATPLAGAEHALRPIWVSRFTVPYLEVAGKVASWPVVVGRPRLIALLNHNSARIGSAPVLLLYDQAVAPEQIAGSLVLRDDQGHDLPAEVSRPASLAHVSNAEIETGYVVAVGSSRLPEHGRRLTLSAPEWLPGSDQARLVDHELTVSTRFRVEKLELVSPRADDRAPLAAMWRLDLTNPVDIDHFREALTIAPPPGSVEVSRGGWAQIRISATLEPGVRYRMSTAPGLSDVLGNTLEQGLDVEVHAQDLAPRLAAPTRAMVLESARPRLPIEVRNVDDLSVKLWHFESAAAFAAALSSDQSASERKCDVEGAARALSMPGPPSRLNVTEKALLPLQPSPGLFCIEVWGSGRGSEASGRLHDAILVQSCDLGLTTKLFEGRVFAWVTRLSDAAPVAGATVRLLDGSGTTHAQATTSSNGVVELPAAGLVGRYGLNQEIFLAAAIGGDSVVLALEDGHLSQPWQYALSGEVRDSRPLNAALFTERGVYRPGETVHLKLILGSEDAAAHRAVEVRIHDPRGQQLRRGMLDLDQFGAADLDLELKEHAAVGAYAIHVTAGDRIATRSFRVEEYRVPTFRVKIDSDSEWRRGSDVTAVISGHYLHGGVLDGREIKWQVWREAQVFAPKAFPKWVFTLAGTSSLKGNIAGRNERLNADGELAVSFRAEHPSSAGPMRYTLEARISDVDRQAYAGRVTRVVHPAAFYVGLRPPALAILSAGDTVEVPIVAVSPEGEALAGVQVRARLQRVDQHTSARLASGSEVQLLNRPVAVTRQECLVTTSATPVSCRFELREAGRFRVHAWAQDADHRSVQAGFEVAASGNNPAAWPRFDQDQITIVTDKPSYRAGDTARLIVQTPFTAAQGLLTIERDQVLSHSLVTINGDTPVIEVPITAQHAPNIYASVVLVRGRKHDLEDASGFETGAPAFRMGYAKLSVTPSEQTLAVEVRPQSTITNPGQSLHVDLSVRDSAGEPASGQATVFAVDEAVLGLTGYRTPDPVAQIHAEQPLGVRTGESRHELLHARRSRRERLFSPGGDGGLFSLGELPDVLRKLFASTAYWNPNVEVGPDGQATVEIELPDNTTTYRLMAVVVGEHDRVGAAENQVVVRKPLMIQPVLPRFVYPGDELRIEALVFNGTTAAGEVAISEQLGGVEVIRSPPERRTRVPAGGQATFAYTVRVTGREHASVRFGARLGDDADAVEVQLPILSPGTRRTLVSSKPISSNGEVAVTLPAARLPGTTQVEVVTSTTVLSELKDAVQYLMRYPNGCIEQTTSTAYPLVVLKDLLPEIGVEVNQADLKKFSEAGIRRILSFQTPSGGLSYWPGGTEPHAFATAFGLTALIEGEKRGYDVPEEALSGMADFLEATLRRGEISESIPHGSMADGDTRALFVMTLGRLGRPQPAYLSALWRERDKLTPFGLSFLALATREMAGDASLLEPILTEIRRAATEEERVAYFEGRRKGGWSFDSPLRTHAGALLAYAASGSSPEMSGKLLNGLLERRRGGLWGNTQENVFGIMGVHALAGGGAGGEAPRIELVCSGRTIRDEEMEQVSSRVRRLTLHEQDLALSEGEKRVGAVLDNHGEAPVFLTVRAVYEAPLDETTRAATANRLSVTRRYESMAGGSLDDRVIPLGSLVRVRLAVSTRDHLNYVAIDDKLPAGLEPLNSTLATTERVARGDFSASVQRSLSVLSYSEIRDSRVAFYVDDMLPADYEFSYVARATTPGVFLRPAARAEAMYEPEISGTTAIDWIEVK